LSANNPSICLPRFTGRGRPSKEALAQHEHDKQAFCLQLLQINSTLDFKVSARGWCYILEEHGLAKGDFDKAEAVINDARKSGDLPIDICAEDESRQSTKPEHVDGATPEQFAEAWIDFLSTVRDRYTPISFWKNQPYYVEMLVEKIDLKSLFEPICDEYRIPVGNTKGWLDINQRARIMQRFSRWENEGKECVLLYCGDHDPAGLDISNKLMQLFEALQHSVGSDPSALLIERLLISSTPID
jgi:hypothetical protein